MNIYSILHYIAIFSLLIPPFFLSDTRSLLIYIIYATLVIMHWKFNNNECILTQLEKNEYPEEFKKTAKKLEDSKGGESNGEDDKNGDKDGDEEVGEEEEEFIVKHLKEWGLESLANFKYFTEVLILLMVLIATFRTYRSL